MSYCAKIPEENQAAALLHYLGISRTRKGYWYIRWILEWGRQEERDEARFYTRLVRRCKVPRLQMARDMYRAQRRVDTLRNYLEEAESVQAGVWALLCVLSRWLNRYEAELPEDKGKMTVRFWKPVIQDGVIQFLPPAECTIKRHIKKMSVKKFGKEQGNFSGLEEFTGGETDELDE